MKTNSIKVSVKIYNQIQELVEFRKIKPENYKKIIDIIKLMDNETRYYFLLRAVSALKETNPELVEKIKNELIIVSDILIELDKKALSVIFKKIPQKELYALLSVFQNDKLNKIYEKIHLREFSDLENKIEFYRDSISTADILKIKSLFIKKYEELMNANLVPYNRTISIFNEVKCRDLKKKFIRPTAVFFTGKQTYSINEKIFFYVISDNNKCSELFVDVISDNKIKFTRKIFLNEYGFVCDELNFETKKCYYILNLRDAADNILSSIQVLVGSKTNFNVHLQNIKSEKQFDKQITSFIIKGMAYHIDTKYKMQVICLHCQNIIDGAIIEIKNGEGEGFFLTENHTGPYLLKIINEAGENVSLFIPEHIPELQYSKSFDLKINDKVNYNQKIELTLVDKNYNFGFVLLSDKNENIINLEYALSLLPITKQPSTKMNELIKSCPESFNSSTNQEYDISFINNPKISEQIVLQFPDRTNLNSVNILFYFFDGSKWEKYCKTLELYQKEYLFLDFPRYIGRNDEIEGRIKYIAPKKSELIIQNGKVNNFKVAGKGRQNLKLNSMHRYNVSLSAITENIEKLELNRPPKLECFWENSSRIIKRQRISFLRKNETYIAKDNFSLFRNVEAFSNEIICKGLLEYPWGCGEQTSSKIFGLVALYHSRNYTSYNYTKEKILARLEAGLNRMKLFEIAPGYYSLWINGNPAADATRVIYRNLSIFYKMPVKEFQKTAENKLKAIEKRINIESENIDGLFEKKADENMLVKDLTSSFLLYSSTDEKMKDKALAYILESVKLNPQKSVYWEDKSFSYGGQVYNTCKALQILMDNNITELNPVNKIIFDNVLKERNIFYKILEALRLIPRAYEKKETKIRKKLSDFIFPAINSIGKSIVNYMPASTSDTTEFISLIWRLIGNNTMRYKTEGMIIEPDEQLYETSGKTEVISDFGIIKEEEELNLNLQNISDFTIKTRVLSNSCIDLEDNFNLEIDCSNIPLITPMMNLYLPGNIAFTDKRWYKFDDQTYQIPIFPKSEKMLLRFKGIRKGKGQIILHIYDMYNYEIQSIKNDIEVKVV